MTAEEQLAPFAWEGGDPEEGVTLAERLGFYLLKHPLQRREDLALALARPASTVGRVLKAQQAQGLLEAVRPTSLGASQQACWYYLTSEGISATAALVGANPEKLAAFWGADEAHLLSLVPRLGTLLHLQQLINGLLLWLPQALGSPGGLRWHWVRDYTHRFLAKGRPLTAYADAVLLFARRTATSSAAGAGQEWEDYPLLVLTESGLAGPLDRAVRGERLRRLLRWRESGERWAWYPHFPPLLVLTASVRAREHWQQCAQQVATEHRLPPLNGAVLVLPPQRLIRQLGALACQRLAPPGPCSLSDLLLPTPRAAGLPEVLAPRTVPAGTFDLGEPPSRRRLVRGDFAQRAAQLDHSLRSAGGSRGSNREEMALLSLRLHRRHQVVLAHLLAAPLLSRREMAVLAALTPATLERTLYDLRQWDLVAVSLGREGLRLALAERGCRLLSAQMGVALAHLAERTSGQEGGWEQRGVRALLRVQGHTSGLYGFLMRLARAAQVHPGDRLLWWEVGARCSRSYRLHGRICTVLPDAAFAYRQQQQTTRALLEWDSGSMAGRDLAIKLAAYRRYVASRAWLAESPVLPRLLFVAPDPGQERRIQRVAQGLLADSTLAVYTTTATRVQEAGPTAPIWWLMQPEESGAHVARQGWLLNSRAGS